MEEADGFSALVDRVPWYLELGYLRVAPRTAPAWNFKGGQNMRANSAFDALGRPF
jgi:hypothetical protein